MYIPSYALALPGGGVKDAEGGAGGAAGEAGEVGAGALAGVADYYAVDCVTQRA